MTMTSSESTNPFLDKTALVTGANSGLGFEAAAQLAEAGYARVILACRSQEKAEAAKRALAERVGSDPFETLKIDVSSVQSAHAASNELERRGTVIDSLLLNAGMVSGDSMNTTEDGLEVAFASSVIGHHVLTLRLLDAGLLPKGARVVIAGSESANNDLPAMMDMKLYDFAVDAPQEFGDNLRDAMVNFAVGARPEKFNSTRYYATTKVFTSWWTAAMARRFGERISIFTVSPVRTSARTPPATRRASRNCSSPSSCRPSVPPSGWDNTCQSAPNATSMFCTGLGETTSTARPTHPSQRSSSARCTR
jgi:NAD(P)-dependent dehydrogenase (short-subunit alcohol dehydrogenase family)